MSDNEHLAELAVLEHLRTWMAGDAYAYRLIQDAKLNDNCIIQDVHNICVEYNVRRGLAKGDEPIKTIISHLKQANRSEPSPKFGRKRDICIELSKELSDKRMLAGKSGKRANSHWLSGASKLVWFWWPDRWTMYDNYAALGISAKGRNFVGQKGNGKFKPDHFNDFYKKAHARLENFCADLEENQEMNTLGLRPERIFDKYLLIKGLRFGFSPKLDGEARKKAGDARNNFMRFEKRLHTFKSLLPTCFEKSIKTISGESFKSLEKSK